MTGTAAVLTGLVNPAYLAVLRSPAHGLLSPWLVSLSFPGRRSGRPYRLPIGYAQTGDRLLVATDARWRHNFAGEHPVAIWLRGRRRTGIGTVVTDPAGWTALLARRPVVGRLAGIRRAGDGSPDPDDLRRAGERGWVLVQIRLDHHVERNDLAGRTAVVTGATSGIGRASALALAERGAQVLAVGRDAARGAELAAHRGVTFFAADLSVQRDVRAVAAALPHGPLDLLVHSAGGHVFDRGLTADGVEANWAINFVSKFLLTALLRQQLVQAQGRVVVVGSPVVDPGRFLRLDSARRRPAVALRALVDSGLATAVWTAELARQLLDSGVTVVNVAPGLVSTAVSRTWPAPLQALDRVAQAAAGIPPEQAAEDVVWLATTDRLPGLFAHRSRRARVPRSTFDRGLGDRVWQQSVELTSGSAT